MFQVYRKSTVRKYESLKRGLKSRQLLFKNINAEQDSATSASFYVAHSSATHGKLHGELIKTLMIAAEEEMYPEKGNLVKNMNLFANTVACRVDDIAKYILT